MDHDDLGGRRHLGFGIVLGDLGPVDLDFGDSGVGFDSGSGVFLDLGSEWTT
jgi:hypothetical protein